jgi:hypothetical protein
MESVIETKATTVQEFIRGLRGSLSFERGAGERFSRLQQEKLLDREFRAAAGVRIAVLANVRRGFQTADPGATDVSCLVYTPFTVSPADLPPLYVPAGMLVPAFSSIP